MNAGDNAALANKVDAAKRAAHDAVVAACAANVAAGGAYAEWSAAAKRAAVAYDEWRPAVAAVRIAAGSDVADAAEATAAHLSDSWRRAAEAAADDESSKILDSIAAQRIIDERYALAWREELIKIKAGFRTDSD